MNEYVKVKKKKTMNQKLIRLHFHSFGSFLATKDSI